ncbi:MAG: nucleotidyltransferase domain-containing protein [Candidatus Xenobiia bacterium LiM19]
MDKSTVMTIINRFHKALEKQGIEVEKLILYGSFAYGTPHEGSDIDLVWSHYIDRLSIFH